MSHVRPGQHFVTLTARARFALTILATGGLLLAAPAVSATGLSPVMVPSINGGTVSNSTSLPVAANGGLSLSSAAGGSGNQALPGCRDNNRNCFDRNDRYDRYDFYGWNDNYYHRHFGEPQLAAAGNGGVAGSSANGGFVDIGNVNSGGNAGNGISVGLP